MKVLPLFLIAAFTTCQLTACNFDDVSKPAIGEQLGKIQLIAEPHANAGHATAVDILFIYDSALASQLPRTSPGWFDSRQEWTAAYPGKFDLVHLEVPPAYVIDTVKLPVNYRQARTVLVYTSYVSSAGLAAALPPVACVRIVLKTAAVDYDECLE